MEELEDRLGDRMDDILSSVKSSLTTAITVNGAHSQQIMGSISNDPLSYTKVEEEAYVQEEIVFDDTGEGAGVEGDLDMDDD